MLLKQWVLKQTIGFEESFEGVILQLRKDYGADFVPWFDALPRKKIQSVRKEFKPVDWSSISEVISATEAYASLLKDRKAAVALYHQCIRLVHDEFPLKQKKTPLDIQEQVAVLCNLMSLNFVELGMVNEAVYWSNEAFEHAKAIGNKELELVYKENLDETLKIQASSNFIKAQKI